MPCIGGPSIEDERRDAQAARELNATPPLLCSACRVLDRLGYDFDENPALSKWWDKHKKEDDARIERERKAKEVEAFERRVVEQALTKPFGELSKDEKKILRKHGYM